MNLFDIVIAKALAGGGGGSSITVEPLSVTENDIYTAPAGKAYSPVTVNVSGGGGGGGDLTIAHITVNNTTSSLMRLPLPWCCEADALGPGSPPMLTNMAMSPVGETVINVPLYKGTAYILFSEYASYITLSGDLALAGDWLMITGDGTITIS